MKLFINYKERQQELITRIKQQFPETSGTIVLFAHFEDERYRFRQESSLYYLTGIQEPAVVFTLDLNGKSTLYIPQYKTNRAQWLSHVLSTDAESARRAGVDAIEYLGEPCHGYQLSPLFAPDEYKNFLTKVHNNIKNNHVIFTLNSKNTHEYVEQKLVLERLYRILPELESVIRDISPVIASLRRKKSKAEIELMHKAIEITMVAQEAAARVVADGKHEREIQAGIEYVFAEAGADPAFPSIVAAGKNSTVLHYHTNNDVMKNGDLVVVDIGAQYNYYCADLTRTYPVSGKFNERQRKLYNIVLETQEYIASLAKPGIFLNNKEHPESSLQHLAKKFLDKHNLGTYFVHGIGHYLGIDVHDVGSYAEPLQEHDVITIEPGIYIPEERIGIRIEDNYWIIKNGSICMSDQLPKDARTIEEMASQDFSEDEEEHEDDDFND